MARRRKPPIGKELLALIVDRLTEKDLMDIAMMDFGHLPLQSESAKKHYRALEIIKDTLEVRNIGLFWPGEVIELASWGQTAPLTERKHLQRAFACLVMTHKSVNGGGLLFTEMTISSLIESLIALGLIDSKPSRLFFEVMSQGGIPVEYMSMIHLGILVTCIAKAQEGELEVILNDLLIAEEKSRAENIDELAIDKNDNFANLEWIHSSQQLIHIVGHLRKHAIGIERQFSQNAIEEISIRLLNAANAKPPDIN